jgi:PAS domain S-box-containing protein
MPDRINNENFQQGTEAPAFRTLAVNIPGIVYRVYLGERGRMTFFNGMLQQMTGYKADELTTGNICSIDPIIFSEDRSSVLQVVNDAIKKNLPFEVEYRIHHKNGSLKYFLEKGSPIYRLARANPCMMHLWYQMPIWTVDLDPTVCTGGT